MMYSLGALSMAKSFKARFFEAVFHSDMSAPAKCIALYVCWHGGCNGDPSKLTSETLMEVASITSEITLRRAKKEVVDAGFVVPGPNHKGGRGNGRLYHPALNFTPETPSKFDPLYEERATDFDPLWDGRGSEIDPLYAQTPSNIDPVKPESSQRGSNNTPLFSDPPIYIEDSLTTDSSKKKKDIPPESENDEPSPGVEVLEAFTRWNSFALRRGLPQAAKLSKSRARSIRARLKEYGGLEGWDKALANIEKSAFLMGQEKNSKGWHANLDFLIQAAKFTKVYEGSYGNGAVHKKSADEQKAASDAFLRMYADYSQELDAQERDKWQT
jgi:hypothetical protein